MGCRRCELACMAEHSDSNTRIFIESAGGRPAPVACRHCDEPLCVAACMSGCMQKDVSTGVVTNIGHEQKCVGCWMCIMACPYGVINPAYDLETVNTFLFGQSRKCDFCPDRNSPACVDSCPQLCIEVTED